MRGASFAVSVVPVVSVETPQPFHEILPGPPAVGASQRLWNVVGPFLPRSGRWWPLNVETPRPVMVTERAVVNPGASLQAVVPEGERR
jgi:hypothetical protein